MLLGEQHIPRENLKSITYAKLGVRVGGGGGGQGSNSVYYW